MIRAQESDISLTLSNVNLSDGKDEDTSATIGTGAEPGATKSTRDLLAPRDANTSAAVTEKDFFAAKPAKPVKADEPSKAALPVKAAKETEAQNALFMGSTRIDLAFLVDATCSMSPYIRAVGEQCISIAEDVSRTHGAESDLRVAFVAYRDMNGEVKNVESLDFTEDLEAFKKFVRGIRVESGVDICEDVFGGLERVGELAWGSGPGNARCLFHLGDAPCHGQTYHDFPPSYDRFPGGDPLRRDLKTLLGQLKEVVGVDEYTFSHITEDTRKMLREFKKVYEGDEWITEDQLRGFVSGSFGDQDWDTSVNSDTLRSQVTSSVYRSVTSSFRSGSNSMRYVPHRTAPAGGAVASGISGQTRAATLQPSATDTRNLSSAATVRAGSISEATQVPPPEQKVPLSDT